MKEVTFNRIMKVLPFITAVISALLALILLPVLAIAAINALFPTAIVYGFKQWCAVALILLILKLPISFWD